jgi:hypothetical protein
MIFPLRCRLCLHRVKSKAPALQKLHYKNKNCTVEKACGERGLAVKQHLRAKNSI